MGSDETVVRKQAGASAVGYFRGVWSELKKVRWPTRKELTNYTVTVLAVCAIMFVLTYLFDLLVTQGFQLLGIGT
ncbi:MAG: preprotein translocase subunit SecE [Firmicutes bacterium]|nr:preprotein translocase subunit SecE [Bacillota bacterium]